MSQQPVRVLVCGSRDYVDGHLIADVLDGLAVTDLAHGCARGADTLAGLWASRHPSVRVHEYPADWKGIGRGAGLARNRQMLDEFRPDLVVAFKDDFDHSLSRGETEHMVKIASLAAIPCVVHDAASAPPGPHPGSMAWMRRMLKTHEAGAAGLPEGEQP